VQLLIGLGADVNVNSTQGEPVLHTAAVANNAQAVKALLAGGAKAEAYDSEGVQAIHCCGAYGSIDAMLTLAAEGTNLKALTRQGIGARELAESNQETDFLEAFDRACGTQDSTLKTHNPKTDP